eukprot:15067-Heterococcus_DN1.PRE.6
MHALQLCTTVAYKQHDVSAFAYALLGSSVVPSALAGCSYKRCSKRTFVRQQQLSACCQQSTNNALHATTLCTMLQHYAYCVMLTHTSSGTAYY